MKTKAEIAESTRVFFEAATTPIDFGDLEARGILKKARGPWYVLVKPVHELPPHARQQITAVQQRVIGVTEVRFMTRRATRKAIAFRAKIGGSSPRSSIH